MPLRADKPKKDVKMAIPRSTRLLPDDSLQEPDQAETANTDKLVVNDGYQRNLPRNQKSGSNTASTYDSIS